MLGYGWLLDPGKLLFLAIFLLVSWIRLYDTHPCCMYLEAYGLSHVGGAFSLVL